MSRIIADPGTGLNGCLPFIKKIPEILVPNFRSGKNGTCRLLICLKFPDYGVALGF